MALNSQTSAIIPVRNEESSLRHVIEQLLAQDQLPHEIIFADGGSTDRTREIVREYIGQGHAIRLVEDADAYPGRARNLAIAAAQTNWVAMTDAGTAIRPDWLANLTRPIQERPDLAVVYGTYEPILTSYFQECLALAFVPPAVLVNGRFFRGPSTASMLIRRDVWESLGRFPEHLRACEDLLFFQRLESAKLETACAPDACVGWNIPNGLRSTFRRFRLYSRHTLAAGMGYSWQRAVVRMYMAGSAVIALVIVHSWMWLVLLLIAAGWRIRRTVRLRWPWLSLRYRIGPRTYLTVGFLLIWLDLAALTGCIDYATRRGRTVKIKPTQPI